MRKAILHVFVLAVCAVFLTVAPGASLAGDATVTNNGDSTVYVRIKHADGSYGMTSVDAGQTATLPSNAARVRINGSNVNCEITKTDGSKVTVSTAEDNVGESIAVVPESTSITVRSNSTVVHLPDTRLNASLGGDNASAVIPGAVGVGSPPAASDGATLFPGGLVGANRHYASDQTWEGVKNHYEVEDADIEWLKREFGSPEAAARYIREWDAFWDMMSGSGDRFGDNATTDFNPTFGIPGQPYGGLPVGSWVHFSRSNVIEYSRDDLLVRALGESGTNNFQRFFTDHFGGSPTEVMYERVH